MIQCANYDFLRVIVIVRNIIYVVKIVIPLIIIIMGLIDFIKIVTAGSPEAAKEASKKLAIRFAAGVVIFMLPTLVNVFMNLASDYSDARVTYKACIENSKHLEYFKALKNDKKAAEKAAREAKEQAELELRKQKVAAILAAEAAVQEYNGSTTTAGTYIGTKHDISDDDISFVASVALCEEGEAGVAASASHIINKYELAGASGSVKDYIINSKWWSCSKKTGSHPATDAAKATVKDVIVLGNRMFPPYVDEHDCYDCNSTNTCPGTGIRGDICSLTTGGTTLTSMSDIKNKSNYSQDQTKIRNVYDTDGSGVYTFYAFGCDSCDPFGYTAGAKAKFDSLNNG